jgi:subtilase family serine protease
MSLLRVFCPRFSLVAACLFLLTLPGLAFAQVSSPTAVPQIVEHVDEGRLVALSGNTRPEARAEFDHGPVAPSLAMPGMLLILRRSPERQAAFDAFVASQYDSHSPNFHRWLTPDEVGEKYGPAQADINTVSSWLQNHGFAVEEVSKNRLTIRFSGTATQVEAAFHTKIHNLQVKGEEHIANMTDPQIPEALTPVVVGVEALHNFFPRPLHRMGSLVRRNSQTGKWERISAPAQTSAGASSVAAASAKTIVLPQYGTTDSSGNPIEDIAPYDFATIYNVLPVWNANINGAGQTIAIVGTSDINPADVTAFRSAFGLPAYSSPTGSTPGFSVIHPNTAPGDCSNGASSCVNDLFENSLDVEWSGAIAKNASIVLVASTPGTGSTYTSDPVYISSSYIVQHNTANIMNVSYGECELALGTTGNAAYNSLWQTASAQGIAVFVASGDQGSASCDAGAPQNGPYGAQFGLSVSGVASTPYDTAVGGTDFNWAWVSGDQAKYWSTTDSSTNLSNALGYIPEFPWNSTCVNPLLVSSLNSNNNANYTATQWCDFIGTQQVTSSTNEQGLLDLVNIVGGSGGKSGCITGDQSSVSSCTKGYAKPSWQTALTPADTVRDIPDISFFAANGFSGSAYVVCVSVTGSCSYTAGTEPVGEEVGGTSVASPIMAAVMALVDQKAGASQGNPNTVLYQLAGKETYSACSSETVTASSTSCVFNDIDTGTIAMPCAVGSPDCTGTDQYGILNGYSASAGYDLATGLGSLNVANFVNSFASVVAPAVTLSPTSLTFSTTEGTTAASQSVTVKNTGGGDDLAISNISITGTNANLFSLASNNCGSTLAVNASCSFTVAFAPHTFGSFSASVSIADNASNSPQTVSLTGTGLEIGSYTLAASTPAAVTAGSSGMSTITATPGSGSGYTSTGIVLTCSVATITGGHDTPTCSAGAAIVVTAGAATSTVTVNTTAPSTLARKGSGAISQLKTKGWLEAGGAALACVLLCGIPARRRYWRSLLGALIFMAALGALSGCGGGGGGTVTQTDPGTTAGPYTVTVTGTDAASVVVTTTFTFTVN